MAYNVEGDYSNDPDLPNELKFIPVIDDDPTDFEEVQEEDYDIDIQTETMYDDDSEVDGEALDDDLEAPENIYIVSQTVRTSPDGRQVVDVVIEVDDVPGIMNYDVRMTKA